VINQADAPAVPVFGAIDRRSVKHVRRVKKAMQAAPYKANRMLKRALEDDLLDDRTKSYLVCLNRDLLSGRAWAFRNFSGGLLASFVESNKFITYEMERALLANPNLDTRSIIAALEGGLRIQLTVGYSTRTPALRKNIFVSQLNDSIFKESMGELFAARAALGLDLDFLASRARQIHHLDQSIPDEWVEKMFA